MMGLFQDLVAIQREIYLAFADRIGDFAKTGDWTLLGAFAFAAVMMIGVALVLGTVALAAVLFRQELLRLLATQPRAVYAVTRTIQLAAGLVLMVVAFNTIRS